MDPLNGSANRAVISDGNVIVSETNATLISLKSDIATSAHVDGIETRVCKLTNVNLSFHSVLNEHHVALRKYQYDVEQTFGLDIRSRSPNAPETDIKAALGNAVEYARASNPLHSIIGGEAGDASTNHIAKELLPKYPDLIFLADSLDALTQSIAHYNTHVQFSGVGVVQPDIPPNTGILARRNCCVHCFFVFAFMFILVAVFIACFM